MTTTPEHPVPESRTVAGLLAAGVLVRVEPDSALIEQIRGSAHQHLTAAGVVGYDLAILSLSLQAIRSILVGAACAAGYEVNTSTGLSENILDPALATAASELPGTGLAIAAFAELRAVWALSEDKLDVAVDAPNALTVASEAVASIEAVL